ncbi:DUF1592 domain-containing protein [Corallococcus sp. bb12-1]|uniref:DUF1592 domain-containing protein n=1 Tax=Corallococcus sp. bb12-1 TaxID=2996784 RepID=UPI00226E9895|nr:DUF1592 domain-containing protein [Corallococcus sp. bb12-1]MCY1046769.1 DUF1592 domain-containing protein [Corallococcus sp. bb12-1]
MGLAVLLLASCDASVPRARVLPGPDAARPVDPQDVLCRSQSRDPGRVTLHRLNRAEYDNTVRDLLGDTSAPARDFPPDDHGFGFDNNADVLSMSPLLMEKYSHAAEQLVERAWAKGTLRTCALDTGAPEACARDLLRTFARRAWRRPVSEQEVEGLVGFIAVARQQGDAPEVGVKLALRSVLVSPHFLFRVELDPVSPSHAQHPISDLELASRLSYFLWSSMPDEALLTAAEGGRLRDPAVLEAQVRRMLADPKARALVDNFAGQWLYTRALDFAQPEARYGFDEPLRQAMREETKLLFQEFITGDHRLKDLLDVPFTYVNDRLAKHYGLPPVGTDAMTRVSLEGHPERSGLFGKGALLTVTANADRTSPVKRGVWVLEQLLCKGPPPPPPDAGGLAPAVDPTLNIKERMWQHRADPTCAGCHTLMDPLGFGMENFDPVGRWRVKEEGGAMVDPSGELPGGKVFNGVVEMRAVVKQDPALSACMTRHLLSYALGRGAEPEDHCNVRDISQQAEAQGGRLTDYILAIVRSDAFQKRGGETEGSTP